MSPTDGPGEDEFEGRVGLRTEIVEAGGLLRPSREIVWGGERWRSHEVLTPWGSKRSMEAGGEGTVASTGFPSPSLLGKKGTAESPAPLPGVPFIR